MIENDALNDSSACSSAAISLIPNLHPAPSANLLIESSTFILAFWILEPWVRARVWRVETQGMWRVENGKVVGRVIVSKTDKVTVSLLAVALSR